MLCVLTLGQRETGNNIRMITIRQADIKVNKVNCDLVTLALLINLLLVRNLDIDKRIQFLFHFLFYYNRNLTFFLLSNLFTVGTA